MARNVKLDKRRLEQIIRETPGKAEDALIAAAFEGQRIVVMSFGSGPAGRTYQHGGVSHTASAPGFPPNIDIGNLKASIYTYPVRPLARAIATGVDYAPHLEYGTVHMAKRPFMLPMTVTLRGLLPDLVRRILSL